MKGSNIVDSLDEFPAWATWSHPGKYLPAEFHCKDGIGAMADGFNAVMFKDAINDYSVLEYYALVVGLFRDMEARDLGDKVPIHVQSSPLGPSNVAALVHICRKLQSTEPNTETEASDEPVPVKR